MIAITSSIPVFAAGIEDFLEVLIPIAFVVIYLIGNAAKAMVEKKEHQRANQGSAGRQEHKQEKDFGPSISKAAQPTRRPAVSPRVQRLPYARAASPAPTPRKTVLERLEELKQQRLAQIRAQQQRTISPPPVHRHPAPQQRLTVPRPVQQPQQPIPVAKAFTVAQPLVSHDRAVKKQKPAKSKTALPQAHRELIYMLRNPIQIRNAIIATEVLGKPVSLR